MMAPTKACGLLAPLSGKQLEKKTLLGVSPDIVSILGCTCARQINCTGSTIVERKINEDEI
jgi:hypothetical protein